MNKILKAWMLLILCIGLQGQLLAAESDASSKQDKKKVKYTCLQKCFWHCKFKNQAVDDCQILNPTTVSFKVTCECRELKKGEILPAYFRNTRIIKTSASSA